MSSAGAKPFYDSVRSQWKAMDELIQLLRYRDLLWQLVRRDVLTRYKRSVLGVVWTMLNPLGMMIVLTVAFSQLFSSTRAYPAYVLSGIVAWTFFAQTTTSSMIQMVWGSALLNRIYLPRSIFVTSAIGTGLVNIGISLVPLALVMLVTGVPLRASVLFLPVSILLLSMFALGVALFLSTLAVYFPDVAEMYQIGLTAWMYLTPIIYPEEILPEAIRPWVLGLNPMYHLVSMFRLPLYDGVLPTLGEFGIAAGVSGLALLIGWLSFTHKMDEFAYRV